MKHIFIVAELGCNHNGNKDIAKKMIDKAKECGVDGVKFQTFIAKELISCYAPKAKYQIETTGNEDSQLEMTAKLELSHEDYIELKTYAESLGLVVFSTPFDMESIDFLDAQQQVIWKIPSGEITNLPYLERIGQMKIEGKKVILSTGMATLDEIKMAVSILKENGMREDELVLLHCNTEYPTPDEDVNILAVNDLKRNFPNISIGFSDHSIGYVASVGAAILQVDFIEKHFTLDKNMKGPDHKASATPEEMTELVIDVRRIETMAGEAVKKVTPSEKKNKIIARKSIVAKRKILKGEIYTVDNITCKRPGNGISPMHWYEVLGSMAERNYNEDELISVQGIKWQEE